jgi:hypothetical protein
LAYISVILFMTLIGSEQITSRATTVAQNTSEAPIGGAKICEQPIGGGGLQALNQNIKVDCLLAREYQTDQSPNF